MTEGRSALIDGRYRYWLRRDWGAGPRLACVGLNPSTADGQEDDPTICVLRNVARREGCGGLVMLNLYAHRATDPDDLLREIQRLDSYRTEYAYGIVGPEAPVPPDPVGPRNDRILQRFATAEPGVYRFVAVWGAGASYARQREVAAIFGPMLCLGYNKDGSPWHPLRKPLSGLWPWAPSLLPP